MNIQAEQIIELLANYVLPFARLSGFLMTMALIGSKNFPAKFRLLLALAIVALVAPVLPETGTVKLFSLNTFVLVTAPTLIGIALGFVSRLLLETFVVGAQIIAMQSGLGFASLVDPANGTSVPALGQFFLMMCTLLFIAFNGHLMMIRILIESFHSLPIKETPFQFNIFYQLVDWSRWIFATALVMALVNIASLLIVNICFGVMTRAAPQINIFAVGFPLTMLAGLILLWFTLSYFLPHFDAQFTRAGELMCNMVSLEC